MWDLAPQPGMEPVPPALAAWRLNPWTAREVLQLSNVQLRAAHRRVQRPFVQMS